MIANPRIGWLLIACFIWQTDILAQNMVTNSNFEVNTGCPSALGQINLATGWFKMTSHAGSPDYMHVCSTNANFSVPTNFNGTQSPASGNAYMGMVYYYGTLANFREYVETQLTSPMIAGQTYLIQLKASLADNCAYSTPSFQFRFTNAVYGCVSPYCNGYVPWGPLAAFPTVTSSTHVTDKLNWTTVSALYTATGGEQYMTIGNFNDDANTPVFPTGSGSLAGTFYYMDDITVVPMSIGMPVDLVEYTVSCINEQVDVSWACASEVNNDYFSVQTSEDGEHFTTVATVDGAGNSSTLQHYSASVHRNTNADQYIRLTQTDFNGQVNAFSTRSIECKPNQAEECPKIYQQNGKVYLEIYSFQNETITTSLYTSEGKHAGNWLLHLSPGFNQLQLDIPQLERGVYFVNSDYSGMKCNLKLLYSPE